MKRIIKKTFIISIKVLAGIALFTAVYFIAVFCLSRIPVKQQPDTLPEIAIYIKTNGAHTDIVMPVKNELQDWSRELKYQNNVSNDTIYEFVGLGWGDKGFYIEIPTWDDLTFRIAFNAAFWLNSTAMHATYYKELTEDETCKKILISRKQYTRLVNFVNGSFKINGQGHYIHIKTDANYGLTDSFYEAKGHYSLFYTCNTWSNNALKVCGQKCCLWTPFDTGIFRQYR